MLIQGRLDEHMKIHDHETLEQRIAKEMDSTKKVDKLSEEALKRFYDLFEKVVDENTEELLMLKCKVCYKREFRKVSSLEKHLQEHQTGKVQEIPSFECCKQVFPSKNLYLKHCRSHEPKSVEVKRKGFQCRKCQKTFRWNSCLQAHVKNCVGYYKGAEKKGIKSSVDSSKLGDSTSKEMKLKDGFADKILSISRDSTIDDENEPVEKVAYDKNLENAIMESETIVITFDEHEECGSDQIEISYNSKIKTESPNRIELLAHVSNQLANALVKGQRVNNDIKVYDENIDRLSGNTEQCETSACLDSLHAVTNLLEIPTKGDINQQPVL